MITITEREARDLLFGLGHPSYCAACHEIEEYGGCETHAACDNCGEREKMGFETALVLGLIDVE